MHKVTVTQRNELAHEVQTRDHVTYTDLPSEQAGTDIGMQPWEMVLGGLGSCVCMTVEMYAKRKKFPLEHISVNVIEDNGDIQISLNLEGDLDHEQRERLLVIATRCPVSRALSHGVKITDKLQETPGHKE